jgi:hypothetical protein
MEILHYYFKNLQQRKIHLWLRTTGYSNHLTKFLVRA